MTLRRSLLSAAVFATACGGASAPGPRAAGDPVPDTSGNTAPPTPTPAAAPRQLATETAIRTAWNATLTVPASWWITESSEVVQVQDPERELTLSFLATPAADRDAAIATAWKRVAPGFSLPIAQAAEIGGRDGWDALAQVAYVTKAEESRIVLALARRKGDTWHVTTIDGKNTAVDRRGAQINALILDMKVPGVDKESFAGRTASVDAAHLAKFDAFVEEARKLTHVPGVAVAVVHGGKIVFEKGYGVRSLRGKQAVTPSTLFMIGSTTKSLTTLMMARLVDQKKFAWTTPVTEVLPAFALADPEVTKKVTVQHTVCACTGMPRQDYEFLFEYDGWDPERRLASLATMKPTTGFGETFQYSNSMVATGGWIGGHAFAPRQKLGPAYDAAMKELVFGPLGMSATTFDVKVATGRDHATSHGHGLALEYQTTPIDYERGVNAMRPAGGAWSNARDMARYLMIELARGKTPDGKQLVSEDNLLERRNPSVKLDANTAYGLPMFVAKENGAAVVHHGGNMLGYTSDMF
ncbi:MAG: serine hydrolase domain-containing protein, partial [Kofleriaceae bacterium]